MTDYLCMSRNVSVVVTDDLDGSAGAETVTFSFDGVTYEIDLSKENRDRMNRTFAPFVKAGRRVPRGARGRPARGTAGVLADRAMVRAWAKQAGLAVSERGRISAEVMRRYEASH